MPRPSSTTSPAGSRPATQPDRGRRPVRRRASPVPRRARRARPAADARPGAARRAVRGRLRRCSTACSSGSSPPTRRPTRCDGRPHRAPDPDRRSWRSPSPRCSSTSGGERRGGFQIIWAFGMLFYGIALGVRGDRPARAAGTRRLYRTWYLTGAVWTAGWLGLGTAVLLGRTRFGYSFALCLFLAGLFTFLVRNKPEYAGAGTLPAALPHRRRSPRARGRGRDVLPERSLAACSRWAPSSGRRVLSIVLMAIADAARARATRSTRRRASRSRRCSRRSSGCSRRS